MREKLIEEAAVAFGWTRVEHRDWPLSAIVMDRHLRTEWYAPGEKTDHPGVCSPVVTYSTLDNLIASVEKKFATWDLAKMNSGYMASVTVAAGDVSRVFYAHDATPADALCQAVINASRPNRGEVAGR